MGHLTDNADWIIFFALDTPLKKLDWVAILHCKRCFFIIIVIALLVRPLLALKKTIT